MAIVFKYLPLSAAATDGRSVEINAVSSPGTTLHTVGTGTDNWEEIFLQAVNRQATGHILVIEFGGTATTDLIHTNVAPRELPIELIGGMALMATTSIVRAYATATGCISIFGHVNRIRAT